MFTPSVHLYDIIYQSRGKNYAAEAASVHQAIQQALRSGGRTLLDVACGTGVHTSYLRKHYQVEGLDLDARMLEAAKQKCPDLTFHLGDMRDHFISADQIFDGVEAIVLGRIPPPVSQGWSVKYMGWGLLAFVLALSILHVRNFISLRGWRGRAHN